MVCTRSSEPWLSIVVASRNDDHGGNLLRRMQIFVSALSDQCRRHGLNAELVVVEWNPPPDRPTLDKALSWPMAHPCLVVRIIEVPGRIHTRYDHSGKFGLFQMIAKNVGIRRSRGRFILCTNVDVLFSDELIRFLASQHPLPGKIYRVDRYDVRADLPKHLDTPELLRYCENNIIQVLTKDGYFAWGKCFATCYRWNPRLTSVTGNFLKRVSYHLNRGIKSREWLLHPRYLGRIAYKCVRFILRSFNLTTDLSPHVNAAGDFTLMARENWLSLAGYSEREVHPWQLDALLVWAAVFSGYETVELPYPMRLFHMEHGSGAGSVPRKKPGVVEDEVEQRLAELGLPHIQFDEYLRRVEEMRVSSPPVRSNMDENWGLVAEELSETVIAT